MWKVIAFLVLLIVAGNFAVRYVRRNPLTPVVDGSQVVVESQDYGVRFQRTGAFSGTYLLADAKSEDWTREPVNARLRVIEREAAREYMQTYADFHRYGSDSSTRLGNVAAPLALIAANRATYGDLQALLSRHEGRQVAGGERICVAVSGEALTLVSAKSLEDGHDVSVLVERSNDDGPTIYADELRFGDCTELLASSRPR
jgi:hypothetical protein